MFSFEVEARDGRARAGRLRTPHGEIETPCFMPVGTAGCVKALTPRDLKEVGASIILANTYHLMLRPGEKLVSDLGGLHGFTGWPGPFLTDSGGYQVFSLSSLRELNDDGVVFRSHIDGSRYELTPERSIEIQMSLGADIIMAFDECPPYPASREVLESAVERTTRWARRCQAAQKRPDQWLFGIIQGGVELSLRDKSAGDLISMGFPGYAIGGLSVGEPKEGMLAVLEHIEPRLPQEKPRYLMGVGTPDDIIEAVARGIDLFDCVLPTRNARNGQLFTSSGRLSIRNARFRDDAAPIDAECRCYTCRTFSRAYVRHLYFAGEITAAVLMTVHNVAFYLDTLRAIRQATAFGRLAEYREQSHAARSASE